MQPYFFPYLGYFQLIAAVDLFIVHDRVKYTKKGWINRNRILQNGKDAIISLPVQSASDALAICEREVATDFDRTKLLNRITEAYRKAPSFKATMPLVEQVVKNQERNLFAYLISSVRTICNYIGIPTPLIPASTYSIDVSLKAQDMVIALCRRAGADMYINPIGGLNLYDAGAFREAGLELRFHSMSPRTYEQFGSPFIPSLSIVDVLMFNDLDAVRNRIHRDFDLVLPRDDSTPIVAPSV
jgi:hypothetical protein